MYLNNCTEYAPGSMLHEPFDELTEQDPGTLSEHLSQVSRPGFDSPSGKLAFVVQANYINFTIIIFML